MEAKFSEGKGGDDDEGVEVLVRVARHYKRKQEEEAFYGGNPDGGLEVIFQDFVDEHAASFLEEDVDPSDGTGHSHALVNIHKAYLEKFESSAEWIIDVEGGDAKIFFAACERAAAGSLHLDAEAEWFLDAIFAAMDFQQFLRLMKEAAERSLKTNTK